MGWWDGTESDLERRRRLRNSGCACHISPPCSWCVQLTEEEADAYWSGGRQALDQLWDRQNDADEAAEALAADFCQRCSGARGPDLCHGEDVCTDGPGGGPAKTCAGWGRYCCRCGYEYAMSQLP
jgi:hypothetical protein